MARYTEAVCRFCRREGMKLFLKSDRCFKDKCALDRRTYQPGQHGQNKVKLTDYAVQLREKQKLRRYYGILERQFSKYFFEASKKKGVTGKNLLEKLERRLDNVIYRMGLALTRAQARQLILHGHIKVNNRKVNIPSFLVKVNDIISIAERSKKLEVFSNSLKFSQRLALPSWLEIDTEKLTGKIKSIPTREDVILDIQEKLVIELYSK
ncbi:MAG: 30S ribosomal protein S4 [Candidatus Firestonebacteria bacterium]|nr:30S ribosomal protein S4 [Candidatus Firestonebacteria bacterium]